MGWRKPKVDMSTLPSVVSHLTGQRRYGPNCWNATILYFDRNFEVRYVDPNEMDEWLQRYTNIDQYQLCNVGTILVMGNEEYSLLHTAVFVAPGILWHKRGVANEWEFVTEKQLFQIYNETTKWHYRTIKESFINSRDWSMR